MELQEIFTVLLTVLGVVLWSMYNDVKKQARDTATELAAYKVVVAEKYVSTEELQKSLEQINRTIEKSYEQFSDRFSRIENRLEAVLRERNEK